MTERRLPESNAFINSVIAPINHSNQALIDSQKNESATMDLLQFLMLNYKLNGSHLRFEIKFFSLHASQNFSSKTAGAIAYLLITV